VVAVAVGILAALRERSALTHALQSLTAASMAGAGACVLAGLACNLLAWRALLTGLGHRLPARPASRIFFVSQLGKYLPGAVWPLVGQAALGRRERVPADRSVLAGLLTMTFSVVSGLVVAAVTLPLLSPTVTNRYWPAFVVAPLLVGALHPKPLSWLVNHALGLVQRPPLPVGLSARAVGAGAAWSVLAWVAFGTQVWLLARDIRPDEPRLLALCLGAFALAWTVGFLAVFVPAGVGVREAVLVLTMGTVLPTGAGLTLALITRGLMTAGDLVCAGAALLTAHLERPAGGERVSDLSDERPG
jgi:hypothetical protein